MSIKISYKVFTNRQPIKTVLYFNNTGPVLIGHFSLSNWTNTPEKSQFDIAVNFNDFKQLFCFPSNLSINA